MSRRLLITAGSVLALLVAATLPASAADDPANVVKYRQTLMKATGAHLGMVASVVKGEVSFTDEIPGNAAALVTISQMLVSNLQQLFPEGTDEAGGFETAALPAIWQNWSGFEAAATKFEEEVTKFAEVAQGGDMATIGPALGALGKNGCGGCHEDFRKKKQ